jgi:hypothetical protein
MTTFPNWFDGQKYNFEIYLPHLQDKPNLRFLQLGVYTGDASEWLLTNILTDQSSSLLDVDTWEGSDEAEHKSISFSNVYEFYKKRMEPYSNVRSVKNNTENFLRNCLIQGVYDFIYIDANHTADAVASDAEYSWELLKKGGIMAFDDYMWGQDLPSHLTPRPAIDAFLEKHKGMYTLLTKEYQVWIQKNDN